MFCKWIVVLSVIFASFSKGQHHVEKSQALDAGAEILYSLLQMEEAAPATQIVPLAENSEEFPVNSAEEEPVELSRDYSQDLALASETPEAVDIDPLSQEVSHESEVEKNGENEKDNYEEKESEKTSEELNDKKDDDDSQSSPVPTLPTPLPVKRPSSTESQANSLSLKQSGRMLPRITKLVPVSSKKLPPVRSPVFLPRPKPTLVPGSRNKPMLKQNPQGKLLVNNPITHGVSTSGELEDINVSAHALEELEPLTEIKYANTERSIDSQEFQDISANQQSHESNGEAQGFDLLSLETSEADISTEIFLSNVTGRGDISGELPKVTSISFSVEQSEEVKEEKDPAINAPDGNTSSENRESSADKKFMVSSVQTSKSIEESEIISSHQRSEEEYSDEVDNATRLSTATEVSENARTSVVYQSFQTSMSISKSISEKDSEKDETESSNQKSESEENVGVKSHTFPLENNLNTAAVNAEKISSLDSTTPTSLSSPVEVTTAKTFMTQISLISETSLSNLSQETIQPNTQTNNRQSSLDINPIVHETTTSLTQPPLGSEEINTPLFDWSDKLSGVFYDRISGKYITVGGRILENFSDPTSSTAVVASVSTNNNLTLQTEIPIGKSIKTNFEQTNQKNISLSLPTEDPSVLAKLLPKSFPTEDPSVLAKLLPKSFPTEDPSVLAKLLPKAFPTEDPSVLDKLLPKSFPTEDPNILAKMLPKSYSTEEPTISTKLIPKLLPTEDPNILAKLLPKSFPTEDPNILAKMLPPSYQASSVSTDTQSDKNEKVVRTFFDKATGKNITIRLLTEEPKVLAGITTSPKTEASSDPQFRTVFNKALGKNITIQIMTEDPSILAAMTPPSTSGPSQVSFQVSISQSTANGSSTLQSMATQTERALVTPKQVGKLPIITRRNVTRKPFLPVRSSTKRSGPPVTFKSIANILNRSRTVAPKRTYGHHQSHEGKYQEDPEKRYTEGPISTTTMRTTTTLSPYFRWGRSLVLSGNLKILSGVEWEEDLRDATTAQFKKTANDIEGSLNNLFKKSSIVGTKFKGVQIEGFSKGVLVDYTVFLNEDTKGAVPQMLKESYREGLGNGTFLGNLKVDPLYVDFRVVKQEEIHAPTAADENQGFPYWAIAIVGIGAASLLFLTVLLIIKWYNKRSVRRKYGAPLTDDSVQDRRKSLEKHAYSNAGGEGLYDMGSMGELWSEKKSKQKPPSTSTYSNQRSLPYGSNQIYQGGVYAANPYQTTDLFTKDYYQTHQNSSKYYDSWNDWDEPYGSHRSRSSYKLDYDTTF